MRYNNISVKGSQRECSGRQVRCRDCDGLHRPPGSDIRETQQSYWPSERLARVHARLIGRNPLDMLKGLFRKTKRRPIDAASCIGCGSWI